MIKIKFFIRGIVLIHFLLSNGLLLAQEENLIVNGGFNGEAGDSKFAGNWYSCDSRSTPDLFDEYIPKRVSSGSIILPNVEGPFVMLRTRGGHRGYLSNSYEYVAQKLLKPLAKDTLYDFSAFYCYNPYESNEDDKDSTLYPVRLELWVGNDSCAEDRLIMQTETLKETFWTKKRCTFIPDTSYAYVRIVAMWDTANHFSKKPYEGMILIDDLSIKKSENEFEPKSYDLIYKGDGKTTLMASEGSSYSWVPKYGLNYNNIQNPIMQSYDSVYTVFVGSLTECSSMEKFHIHLVCDTLHPENERAPVYLDYVPNLILPINPIKEGDKYIWEPADKVIIEPNQARLTEYDSLFTLTVIDKYGCRINKKYLININCDKIVTEKNVVVLKTDLQKQTPVALIPTSNDIVKYWEPQTGLSCTECVSPLASPVSSTTYAVDVRDKYGCFHTESFVINVDIFIPNIITPNGDGINDYFEITGLPENSDLRIFDKSGNLLFIASPYINNSWNGCKSNGTLLETNNYWYVIENKSTGLLRKGFIYVKR
jgi:gliding motility-associated-like protein